MEESLISQGLSLMVFGMGFVFVFLTLLVGVTSLMSKLVTKYAPAVTPTPKKRRPSAAVSAKANNDEVVAVITAAVHQYRS